MGHVGSKARSCGQVLKKKKIKKIVRSSDYIYGLILMKLCQNVCLDEILDEVEIRSCLVKNLGQ